MILDMKRLGHPSFIDLDEENVKDRAAELPDNAVPPEVVRIINEAMGTDDSPMDSKLQPQKAAAPCEAPDPTIVQAGDTFSVQRPRTVVAEGQSKLEAHEAERLSLENLVGQLRSDGVRFGLDTYEVRAGNQLIDMFRPCYWAIAFCFLFKHATAEPEVTNTANKDKDDPVQKKSRRKRGSKNAPEVNINAWGSAIQRRVEAQFRRDWNFSPALWNYIFRTMINQEPNAYMYAHHDLDGRRMMTNKEIQDGAQEIYRNMHYGMYVDSNNENKLVNGDLSKLRYVPTLSAAALKVLNNTEARARKVPGTHEVRTTMRHQTHAYRVLFGLSVFITFSPSERDSCLMLRMVRARRGDPAIHDDPFKAFYDRNKPDLDVEFCRLSAERLAEAGA